MKKLMKIKHGLVLFLSALLLVGSLPVEAANSGIVEKPLLPSGTGAITSTTRDKLAASVSVKDFGAKLDGVTDISAAIALALNSMTSGTLLIPGDAKISAPIRMKSNVDVLVTGTLDAKGLSSAFNWTGVSVLTTALAVQANAGDHVVTVASSAGISNGDYVVLENNVFHTFSGTWPGIDSHFAQVTGVAGNVLTLNNSVPEVFPIASSQIRKITPIENANAKVKKIIGAPQDAFYMKWAIHNECTGEVNPIGTKAVRFFAAFGNKATGIRGINPLANTVSPNGYGGAFDFGASDNVIENSYFENIREIAHGFNARRNIVRNNNIIRPFDNGVNTHGLGSVDAVIEDNTITDAQQYGIAVGQKPPFGWWPDVGTKILRNKIINSKATGIREAQFDAPIATGTVIEDNDIRNVGTGNSAGNNHGIAILGSATATSIVNPIIRRNKIKGTGTAGGIGILIQGISAKRTVIDDNDIDTTGGSGIRWNSAGGDHSADGNVLRNIGERGFQSNGNERIILGKRNRVESSTLGAYLNVKP
jgi:Right handed beta helix region